MLQQKTILSLLVFFIFNFAQAQYITQILEYKPAPGQFTNTSYASPEGAASIIGGLQGTVSLGAFGGYIVFKFENPVQNDPDNPFGVDFTIFGNPIKNPVTQEVTWSEHGIVSVMKDENNNGLPDDTWYELAGSEYFFSSTLKNYAVTYTNPNEASANVPWADNQGNSGFILTNEYHEQPYYPTSELFPEINTDEYTLTGTRLPNEVDKSDPSDITLYAKAFGYADNQAKNLDATTYVIPDNPYTKEREGSLWEYVIPWTSYYPYHFESPFAAYLIPKDIAVGERVFIEDLIEDFLGGSHHSSWRLESCEAIWNGSELEIEIPPPIELIG